MSSKCVCGRRFNKCTIYCKCGKQNPSAKLCGCGSLMADRSSLCGKCSREKVSAILAERNRKPEKLCPDCNKKIKRSSTICRPCFLNREKKRKEEKKNSEQKLCRCGSEINTRSYYCETCLQKRRVREAVLNESRDMRYRRERIRALPVNPRLACPGYDLAGKHHKCAHNAHPLSTLRDGKYHRAQCSLCYNIELGLPPITTTLRWDSFALTSDY